MLRNVSRRSFRPHLETLEGRDLPSSAGVLIFFLTSGLQTQINTVQNDFNKLQTDVNTSAKNAANMSAAQSGAGIINNDLSSLQTDFTTLKNSASSDEFFFVVLAGTGSFDSTDFFFVSSAFTPLTKAIGLVNELPPAVTQLGNQFYGQFGNGTNNSINFIQNSVGDPSLSIM